MFQIELADINLYTLSKNKIELGPAALQELNIKAQNIKIEGLNRYKNVDQMLHHQRLLFVSKII